MRVAMVTDGVPAGRNVRGQCGELLHVFAQDKEGGADLVFVEKVQEPWRHCGIRSVVECQRAMLLGFADDGTKKPRPRMKSAPRGQASGSSDGSRNTPNVHSDSLRFRRDLHDRDRPVLAFFDEELVGDGCRNIKRVAGGDGITSTAFDR